MDKAIIAGLTLNQNQYELNQSLEELANLALTLQIEVVDRITQNRFKPTPNLYFGRGKIEEIKMSITHYEADILIVDDTLSPAQIRNLEASLEIQIIDRSFLILQIFSLRAQSKEAILEVKLAQNQYMLPRLVGLGKSLSRQGGGTYNAKGPGETKLEMDRRKLLDEISKINKELKTINKQRTQARIQRKKNEIPVVSLVGYTNAGKSAILNNLSLLLSNSNQLAFEENILFATLDTKSRLLQKENNPPFILIDTVGFISKLPPELINSFKSTLSDIQDSDLIIHVIDGLNPSEKQVQTTLNVLAELKIDEIERLTVVTKKDLIDKPFNLEFDYILISNKTRENIDNLIDNIYLNIYPNNEVKSFIIPFDEGQIFNYFKEKTNLIKSEYRENGIYVLASVSPTEYNKFKKYEIK